MRSLSFFKRSELLTVSMSIAARTLDVDNVLIWFEELQGLVFNKTLGIDDLKSILRNIDIDF